jgi:hypothetical protein
MSNPLHRIFKWNNLFFEATSLSDLGLLLVIRHEDRRECPNPHFHAPMTIIHVNGFHQIPVQSCGCAGSQDFDIQLLQLRLFAASSDQPKTAFTFDVLEQYRLIHLEGKASSSAFMQSIVRMTGDEHSEAWPTKVSTSVLQASI